MKRPGAYSHRRNDECFPGLSAFHDSTLIRVRSARGVSFVDVSKTHRIHLGAARQDAIGPGTTLQGVIERRLV